jgi:hypothetical protein
MIPANTWAVVTTPFSIDWCSTSRRWRLHSESSSKPYAVVCERHRARPRPRSAAARVSPPRPGRHASLAVLSGWGRPGAFQPVCQGGHASRQALGTINNNLVCGGSHPARVAHSPTAAGSRMKHLWSLRLQVAVPGGCRGGPTGPYCPSGQSAARLGASGDRCGLVAYTRGRPAACRRSAGTHVGTHPDWAGNRRLGGPV